MRCFSILAARALATINSEASNKTLLLAALANATGNASLSIVQALGDTRYREAVVSACISLWLLLMILKQPKVALVYADTY